MSDPLSPAQRHKCMSHNRSSNTKPEVKLRKELFGLGYRYRINKKGLPGSPDIVLAKYRTCIFVNGCFWHGHKDCRYATRPKTNAEFWRTKIAALQTAVPGQRGIGFDYRAQTPWEVEREFAEYFDGLAESERMQEHLRYCGSAPLTGA